MTVAKRKSLPRAVQRVFLLLIVPVLLAHILLWIQAHRLLDTILADRAALLLEALAASADQTLQASHFLEEKVVAALKRVAARIAALPPAERTLPVLSSLQAANDLRSIAIYHPSGEVIAASEETLIGTTMPAEFGCHDVLSGERAEHVFGFSQGVFCESDAFGLAKKLPDGSVVRLLTGVEFVLGFEQEVGLSALFRRFRAHPGVTTVDLLDGSGKPLIPPASPTPDVSGGIRVSRDFFLHGARAGTFTLVLNDGAIGAMKGTLGLAIAISSFLSTLLLIALGQWWHHQREVQEKSRQMEETERRIEGLGKIVAMVAHEIRNPLNTLQLSLESMKADLAAPNAPTTLAARLNICQETVDQVNLRIKELLAVHRPILRTIQMMPLPEWLGSLSSAFGAAFPACRLEISGSPPAQVETDPDLLHRVLWNLLQNSAQAGATQIALKIRPVADFLELVVEDNGPGMSPEVLNNLFVPGNTSRAGGSGLGLFACRRIIQVLAGTIEVDSRPGRTACTLTLPLTSGGALPQ